MIHLGPMRAIKGAVVSLENDNTALSGIKHVKVTKWYPSMDYATVPLSADGTFSVALPEGRYRIDLPGLPVDSYIGSVQYGLDEVLHTGFVIDGNSSNLLTIGVASGKGAIEGFVHNAKGERIYRARVALLPADNRSTNLDLIRTTTTDALGTFSFSALQPGSYILVALETYLSGAQFPLSHEVAKDPEFLKQFEKQQTRIVVDGRMRQSVSLQIIHNFSK
jgi:hypothetical protein